METAQIDLKREYKTTAIISGAMMISLVFYAVVVEVLRFQHKPFEGFAPNESLAQMRDIFYAIAFLALIAIRLVRKTLLKEAQTENLEALVRKLKISTIVTFALSETPTILGLILFLVCGLHREFYIFLLFSLLLMVLYFPKYNHWVAWSRGTSRLF